MVGRVPRLETLIEVIARTRRIRRALHRIQRNGIDSNRMGIAAAGAASGTHGAIARAAAIDRHLPCAGIDRASAWRIGGIGNATAITRAG